MNMSYEEFVSNGHGWIITDEDDIRHFHRLMEQLDDVEDAQDVYHNVEM